jgi:hypothetical protein
VTAFVEQETPDPVDFGAMTHQEADESRLNAFGPMIRVPQLCGNENVFACDPLNS